MTAEGALPDAHEDRLFHSATALLISNVTSGVLGFAFWVVAARVYNTNDVGNGVAAISAMVLLASIAQLNLSAVFPRFLHAAGVKAPSMLRAGYGLSILLAVVAGAVFVTLTGHHDFLSGGHLEIAFFMVAVVLWVIFTIEDAALIGLRATFWVPVENTSFSIVKIALLPVFVAVAPHNGVFLSWVLPVIACIVPINYFLFFKVLPRHVAWSAGRASLPPRRAVGNVLVGEYFGGIAYIALTTIPALLIVGQLGRSEAAYFQAPWLAGTTFDFLLFSIATSLIVESSARPGAAAEGVRRAVKLTVWLLGPGMVVLVIGAPYLLRIQGAAYASHGTRLLQLLALALPFMGVNVLYVTFARLARRVRRVFGMQVCVSVLVLTLSAVLLRPLGITGVGVAFLSGQALAALVVLPSVARQYRHPEMLPRFEGGAALVASGADVTTEAAVEAPAVAAVTAAATLSVDTSSPDRAPRPKKRLSRRVRRRRRHLGHMNPPPPHDASPREHR